MNIWMIGGGSLGLLFAGKLAFANARVHLLTRTEEQCIRIRRHGVVVHEGGIRREAAISCSFYAERFATDTSSAYDGQADWIFLMVKQHQIVPSLIDYLGRLTDQGARLLCFQNGIGHVEQLSERIPLERIYIAVTTEGARKQEANEVAHTGKGTTWIGCSAQAKSAASAIQKQNDEKDVADLLANAGFSVNISKNINNSVWNKLLINSVINPLTAILKTPNGQLTSSQEWLQVMRSLYEEGKQVALASGIEVAADLWEQILEVCRQTAQNQSSMLQDVLHGRPTEADWINGGIVRLGRVYQLQTPAHLTVYNLVKGMEFQ